MAAILKRKAVLESQLKKLTSAAGEGMDSPAIRAAITEREAEISPLTDRTLGAGKGSVRRQMRDLRRFVKDSLGDIRGLLAGKHANVAMVRQELAKLVEAITLSPDEQGLGIKYRGKWALLGGSTGCAEGGNCTMRATLFRRMSKALGGSRRNVHLEFTIV